MYLPIPSNPSGCTYLPHLPEMTLKTRKTLLIYEKSQPFILQNFKKEETPNPRMLPLSHFENVFSKLNLVNEKYLIYSRNVREVTGSWMLNRSNGLNQDEQREMEEKKMSHILQTLSHKNHH